MQDKIVYFDSNYPSSWTKDVNKQISNYLSQKNFTVLDSITLRKWMKGIISTNDAAGTVVVFANDIVPDSIYEDGTPNITLRKYLDIGGRVIWIGDIPLWNKGVLGEFDLSRNTAYQSITFLGVLGVSFAIALPSEHVQFTDEAREMGLKNEWYSIRPISVEKNKTDTFFLSKPCELKTLATAKTIFAKHLIKKNDSRMGKIENINLSLLGFGGGVGISKDEKDEKTQVDWGKEYISSFKVTLNQKYPNQGFIRIWDFPIYEVSDAMLLELEMVATNKIQ